MNMSEQIIAGSVWRLGNSLELVVVTEVGADYVIKQYLDGNNGMTRTASATIENFLKWHTLFYSPAKG